MTRSRSALALATAIAKRWSSSDLANNNLNNARVLSHKIRVLLRETAQPVAVVTSFMPMPNLAPSPSPPTSSFSSTTSSPSQPLPTFHGATLSSFTSISMAPHHLVAFSLRIPSRMATTLADLSSASALAASASAPTPAPTAPSSSAAAHMVINLLAAPQAHAATLFSRPDLHPRPFEDPGIEWSLSDDGLPMLHGCLGALSCRVVGAPWRLSDLAALGDKLKHRSEGRADGIDAGGVKSELFIAQVLRVEDVPPATGVEDDDTLRTLPLVYHRQSYTTTADKLLLKTNS